MTTLFISDLHLDETRPEVTEAFLEFLRERGSRADALYILGDLFEAWIGDDDDSALATTVANALSAVSAPKFYMHGNRDFLLGLVYAHKCGMTILDDPTVIDLYGVPTLLSHGDVFCTDDVAYQQFRAQVRDPAWQQGFLAQPLEARRAFAAQARAASASHQAGLSNMEVITDVTPAAVDAAMAASGASLLIHGHTHRPDRHVSESFERIVLGDWYEQGSVLVAERDGSLVLDSFGFAIPT